MKARDEEPGDEELNVGIQADLAVRGRELEGEHEHGGIALVAV